MEKFKYADDTISDKEIMIAIPSMLIAVGVLTIPRELAKVTVSSDGWISLLIAGIITIPIIWMVAKLAASFPNQSFLTYASTLVTKPVAITLTFIFGIYGILLSAYEVFSVANTSQRYLFDKTPLEVIALTFLLVVVYAVSGSRAGIFRLNMLFLPIILFISFIIVLFSIPLIKIDHLLPVFKTDVRGSLQGIWTSMLAFSGYGILLFYIAQVRQPKKAPQMAIIGLVMTVCLFMLLFIATIAVFGNIATTDLLFPTIELSKAIEIPGGILERFESLFFVIWIMAIFNTAAMSYDVAVLALQSIFSNVKKIQIVVILSPITYFISMLPQNMSEIELFKKIINYVGFWLTAIVAIILLVILKIKGVKAK